MLISKEDSGKSWSNSWSFSLDFNERVLFYFTEDGKAVFVDIGSHDEVY